MHWGLIPHWAEDPTIGNRMINARAETLTENYLPSSISWIAAVASFLLTDFYEWRKEGKRKVPMWVYLKNREPFGLGWLVGRVAQAGWEAGGVVHDHHDGT